MADSRIRIILEGVDRFSKTLKGANKSIDEFGRLGTKRFNDFNSDVENTRQHLAELVNDLDRQNVTVSRTKNSLASLGGSYRALKNEIRGAINEQRAGIAAFGGGTVSRGPGGRFTRNPPPEPSNVRQFASGLGQGLAEARETRRTIIAAASQNKRDIELRRQALADELRQRQINIKREIALKVIATKQEFEQRQGELNKEINALRKAAPQGFERLIADKTAELRADKSKALLDIELEGSKRQSQAISENAVARRNLTSPNIAEITRKVLEQRKAVTESENGFQRLGRRAGLAFGDIGRGFDQGKRGIVDLTGAGRLVETTMSKIGLAAGSLVRNFNNLVNLRWFLLISALQLVGTLVVQLGAALASVAVSAGLAGAALGGAFASGLAQAAAAGGLLKAALSRVQTVIKAGQIADQQRQQASVKNSDLAKQQRTAIEQLADAHYALKQAIQGVSDAEYQQRQAQVSLSDAEKSRVAAIKNLAETRKSVARGIVDANFAERDAAFALRDAEFAVIDAKKKLMDLEKQQSLQQSDIAAAQQQVKNAQARLAQTRQQGDQQQVLAAEQQLAAAQNAVSSLQDQQSVSKTDIAQAKSDISKAQLQREEAAVASKRAREDNKKAQREGIAGNQQTIDAQKQLADSIRQIAAAQHDLAQTERARADAIHGVAIARRNLKDTEADKNVGSAKDQQLKVALAGLSPAEKQLFHSIQRIKKIYKDNFRPITDIIIRSFSGALDRVSVLLKDPQILNAFKTLAKAMSAAVTNLSKFAIKPEFRKDIAFFAKEAAKNIPHIVKIFENLLWIFLRIAKAGTPLFDNLTKRIEKFTGKIKDFTDPKKNRVTTFGFGSDARDRPGQRTQTKSQVESILGLASEHLNSWIRLAEAIGKVFLAFGKGAQGTGKGFVDDLADALDRLAIWLDTHQQEVSDFFTNLRTQLHVLAPVVGSVFKELFKGFTGKGADNFSKLILTTIIPGLALMFATIGKVSGVLLTLFNAPIIGGLLQLALQIAVAEKALNKVFPASQHATNGLKFLAKKGFKEIRTGFLDTRLALAKFSTVTSLAIKNLGDKFTGGSGEGGLLGKVKLFGKKFGTALSSGATKATGGLKKFASSAVEIVSGMSKKIIAQFAKINFASIASSFGTALLTMGRSVLAFSKTVALAFITPPLSIILIIGAIITAIILLDRKFHFLLPTLRLVERVGKAAFRGIVNAATDLFNWFKNHWKTIATILIAIFLPGGIILLAIIKWRKQIVGIAEDAARAIWGWFKKLSGWIYDIFIKLPIKIVKLFFNLGKKIVDPIVTFFEKLPDRVLGALKDLPKDILKLFDGLGKKIGEKILGFLPKKARNVVLGAIENALPGAGVVKGANALRKKLFAVGGEVGGTGKGDTVPAMLTPGEWVLNKMQQSKLAKRLKTGVGDLSRFLFGSNKTTPPRRTKPSGETPYVTPNFTLHPQQDEDGNIVWFIEFGDRTWGQITARAANRIMSSDGNWFPGYAKRAAGGHKGFFHDPRASLLSTVANSGLLSDAHDRRFALGGVVPGIQRMSQGGPVLTSPGGSGGQNTTKNINVSMQPVVQGDSDWNYVMRLAALHAEGAF